MGPTEAPREALLSWEPEQVVFRNGLGFIRDVIQSLCVRVCVHVSVQVSVSVSQPLV